MCVIFTIHDDSLHTNGNWRNFRIYAKPSKINPFCWRLLHCWIPTLLNLYKLCINCQSDYVRYSSYVDDDMHNFLECAYATNCWKETNLWSRIDTIFKVIEVFLQLYFPLMQVWMITLELASNLSFGTYNTSEILTYGSRIKMILRPL